jgi:glycerophosphoryl diester phosphodiesterase
MLDNPMIPRIPRILAHRGASGGALENSLAAFRLARDLGSDGVELDVHATRDGTLIVHHDPELQGVGMIRDQLSPDLRGVRLPNGEPIPTLEVALAALSGLEVWIEVKTLPEAVDSNLLGVIAGAPTPAGCAVHSFDHRIIARLGSKAPLLRRGILSVSYPVDPIWPMAAAGATTLWQQWHSIDPELIAAVHRRGWELIAWTVNDPNVYETLKDLGVDAVCGNYPERLRPR